MNNKGSEVGYYGGGTSSDPIDDDDAKQQVEDHHQLCGSKHCAICGNKLEGSKAEVDWIGLPAGVKFDPTDHELIEHLEAKVNAGRNMNNKLESHPLIDEFIPTLQGEDGICYTHPEKLPGVTRDGLSRHFFHKPSKAYTTGTRKRRKIQLAECNNTSDLQGGGGETRWHKTGKTRPVLGNGKLQKGCKKILVLYTNFGKNRKPEKTNWVMHQYHLGQHEEEKEGELVVSKIFYQTQPRQCGGGNNSNWVMTAAEQRGGGAVAATVASATSSVTGEGSDQQPSGGGVGSSISSGSKEMAVVYDHQELISIRRGGGAAVMSGYGGGGLEGEHFGFGSVYSRKAVGFDHHEAAAGVGEASSTSVDVTAVQEHNQQAAPHHHYMPTHHPNLQQEISATTTAAAFHMIRNGPIQPISHIISSPTTLSRHASMAFDYQQQQQNHHRSQQQLVHHSYQVPRLILPHPNFQGAQPQSELQEQQTQHHHKIGERSSNNASGLEEIIMACNSSQHIINKERESSSMMANPQEAEWFKYSSAFWHDDPGNNPDHHHGHGR